MIIDFHTHVFPDALAPKAGASLSATAGFPMFSDLTVAGQLAVMAEDGIDHAVVLNTVTNTRQVEKVNGFALETAQNVPSFTVFGSVHPLGEDPVGTVKRLYDRGIRGLKLHPDYLGLPFDHPAYRPILKAASELQIPVVIHAGFDPVSPDLYHAPPKMIRRVAKEFPELILVCAHMGGMGLWDEVLEELCGRNVYFDTAMCCERAGMNSAMGRALVAAHGANRILFGSDLPWARPAEILSFLDTWSLAPEEKDAILRKNAKSLLRL
jgi:predicted TIM-barrel fold metal-dependent hydrolase